MNFTILIFLFIFTFLGLWLSAKYLGKFGLSVFSVVTYTLSLVLTIPVSTLTANVSVGAVFFISSVFSLYMLIKKYGLKEGARTLSVILGVIVLYFLFELLAYLYMGALFFETLGRVLLAILVQGLAFLLGFGIVYWLFSIKKLFNKLNQEFKEFLIILIGLFVYAFIAVFMAQIGEASFVQMLLNWLVTYLVYVILVAVYFICDRFIIIEENVTFGDNVNEKISRTIEKTRNAIIKKGKTNKTESAEKEEIEIDDEDDDDDFDFDFDEYEKDILPNKNASVETEEKAQTEEKPKSEEKVEEKVKPSTTSGVVIRQRPRQLPEKLRKQEEQGNEEKESDEE